MCNVSLSWSKCFLLRKWKPYWCLHSPTLILHRSFISIWFNSSPRCLQPQCYNVHSLVSVFVSAFVYMYLYDISINHSSVKRNKCLQLNHSLPAFDMDLIHLHSAYNRDCTLSVQLRRSKKVFYGGIDWLLSDGWSSQDKMRKTLVLVNIKPLTVIPVLRHLPVMWQWRTTKECSITIQAFNERNRADAVALCSCWFC